MRKTKIICTIGPATEDEKMIRALMENGMNVARLNFSHGTHETHAANIKKLKAMREKLGLPIGIMLDTKGPEIRLGTFAEGFVTLVSGDYFTLTTDDIKGTAERAHITYKELPKDVRARDRIMIDDGLIELRVEAVEEKDILCKVVSGGVVSDRKSVNVPGVKLSMPFVSEQDRADLLFGIEHDVDFIAASFSRNAMDILEIKSVLENNNGKHIQIIAKIENQDGVNNADEIIKVADGIMVARGDMGVEIAFEELPRIQKELIEKCYRAGKKVITATQMLESMVANPRPTRAEATDVANAIYDGTSAIMLSGETAVGKYPIESLKTMSRIAETAEDDIDYIEKFNNLEPDVISNVTNAISHATCMTAHDLGAAAIITVTKSGYTARMVSSFRPACPIITCALDMPTCYKLALSWGVLPIMSEVKGSTDELFEHAVQLALKTGLVRHGDLVAITAGIPLGISGTTNILKVHIVGNVLVQGEGVNGLSASGKLCVGKKDEDVIECFEEGDILVMPRTDNTLLSIMRKASAVITEDAGATSHAAIVGLTLQIPVICGAQSATDILKSGTAVTVDATNGIVYSGIMKGV